MMELSTNNDNAAPIYAGLILDGDGVTVGVAGSLRRGSEATTLAVDANFPEALAEFLARWSPDANIGIGCEVLGASIPNFSGSVDLFRGISKFGTIAASISGDKRFISIHDIPKNLRPVGSSQRDIRLVLPGMARAFATFFHKSDGSLAARAIMLSTICSSRGMYHYCRSVGVVQSAADVAVFLRAAPQRPPSFVVSGDEMYGLLSTERTALDVERGQVFLQYELGKAAYPYLSEPNSLKMGLLHACSEYDIRLCCDVIVEGALFEYFMGGRIGQPVPREFDVWSADSLRATTQQSVGAVG